jgi:IS5 family transposase
MPKALHGNPFDVDKVCRGQDHPHRFRVWISGQVRRVTNVLRREMRRWAAVEPVIGDKDDNRMRRNYLTDPEGDCANAVLAVAG